MNTGRFNKPALAAAVVVIGCALSCEPKLSVGEWTCPSDTTDAGAESNFSDAAFVPWSTSFEREFCDYERVNGYCYADADASYSIVTAPVRTGKFAAAFRVRGTDDKPSGQARCVVQGVFPKEAYYSAWYFIPESATEAVHWNLFHFLGREAPDGLWDISIAVGADGEHSLYLFDFLPSRTPTLDAFPAIPIGAWFQIEVFFRRASDETGELSVFQDGRVVFRLTDLVTDPTTWGQWYVGNLTTALVPPDFTVYVDDVMIRATR